MDVARRTLSKKCLNRGQVVWKVFINVLLEFVGRNLVYSKSPFPKFGAGRNGSCTIDSLVAHARLGCACVPNFDRYYLECRLRWKHEFFLGMCFKQCHHYHPRSNKWSSSSNRAQQYSTSVLPLEASEGVCAHARTLSTRHSPRVVGGKERLTYHTHLRQDSGYDEPNGQRSI